LIGRQEVVRAVDIPLQRTGRLDEKSDRETRVH
jgi:hypothetical protein